MKEYICKEDIRNKLYDADAITMRGVAIINDFPAADVVPKSVLEQVMWERDIAIEQLGEIGKGLGEKMNDVRPVVRGKWVRKVEFDGVLKREYFVCSECGQTRMLNFHNYCPNCGADMREES